MKIAGLTWWRNNYGSILQAFALQEVLNDFDNVDYEIICQYGKQIASIDNLLDKLKKIGIKKTLNRIIWKFVFPGLNKRNIKIQNFVNTKLRVSDIQYTDTTINEANNIYDGFVCGSDQIWNLSLESESSIYWLRFVKNSKLKFSYAPSIGTDNVTKKQAEVIKENLKDFYALSCREESGTKLINDILGDNRCVTVVDPTLLINPSIWNEVCAPRKYNFLYIFVYMLRGNKEQRKLIESFAKEKGLKIVTMPFLDTEKIEPYDFKFGDVKYWDAAPDEFISVIRNAEYVFTDSFHCMIFSCLYHRDFYVFPKIGPAQLNRMTSFQRLINAEDRMITDNTILEINKTDKINWDYVDSILKKKRLFAYKYIESIINGFQGEKV